jgi:hypothetical protein
VRVALLAALALLLFAGCASDPIDTSPAPTGPESRREAAAVAVKYVSALVNSDWAAACETRIAAEQRKLADAADGSCARAFERIFKQRPTTDRYVGVRAGEVRIEGPLAGIDMIARGEPGPRITFGAVRENGEWRLKDLPKHLVP